METYTEKYFTDLSQNLAEDAGLTLAVKCLKSILSGEAIFVNEETNHWMAPALFRKFMRAYSRAIINDVDARGADALCDSLNELSIDLHFTGFSEGFPTGVAEPER